MARTKQTARKHTAGRGPRMNLPSKKRTPQGNSDNTRESQTNPAPSPGMLSIIRNAHKQLADEWPAGSKAERKKLINKLVERVKGDSEHFKINWHTFKARFRRVDASSIHTCRELIKCIRKKTAEDNEPKLEAAAERHKQTIDTKTPEEKQHEAKQFEAGKSFGGKSKYHPF